MSDQTELEEMQALVRALQREWLAVKLEDAAGDAAGQKMKEEYLQAEKRKSELVTQKEHMQKQLVGAELAARINTEQARGDVKELYALTSKEAETEKRFSGIDPFECCEKLTQICMEREAELQDLYKQIEAAEKEDQGVKERLRVLQQRAPSTIPKVIQEKDEILRAIDEAWRLEKAKLNKHYTELTRKQRQLSWHLNRGSYIKQQPIDPRTQGQFGIKGKVEVKDHRLAIWEERLVQDHIDMKGKAEDYKLQKIQIACEYERMRSDYEDRVDGKRGLPGSRPAMDDMITLLKTQLVRESKSCKDLVNENAELKALKKQMEDEIKEQRKYSQQLVDTRHRQQLQEKLEERQRALEANKKPQPRAQPLTIMEGANATGKKRFEPRH
eukprot:TRINITY_DN3548_c0_g1_i2.p1 TRINITY_DN3548_c0_g1~~TRINITY_DN3548_c0_g1_i2.p1  ORF type:complete len:385 (+),score=157.73 TRINITY_DN3548_c0_g1_i2:1331-2485(+)